MSSSDVVGGVFLSHVLVGARASKVESSTEPALYLMLALLHGCRLNDELLVCSFCRDAANNRDLQLPMMVPV